MSHRGPEGHTQSSRAPVAVGTFRCKAPAGACGFELVPYEQILACPTCGPGFCPFCGAYNVAACPHLVGGFCDEPFGRDAFDGMELPSLQALGVDELHDDDWSESDIQELFGELAPLVSDAYDLGVCSVPYGEELLEAIAQFVHGARLCSFSGHSGPGTGWASTVVFAPDEDHSREAVESIISRLSAGFEQLATRVQARAVVREKREEDARN